MFVYQSSFYKSFFFLLPLTVGLRKSIVAETAMVEFGFLGNGIRLHELISSWIKPLIFTFQVFKLLSEVTAP